MKSAKAPLLLALLLASAGFALAAEPPRDLINSPGCKLARERFDAAFEQAQKVRPFTMQALDEARHDAALACFGSAATSPPPSGIRSPQPTVVVPQAAAARRALPTSPPSSAGSNAPVQIDRPSQITSCDSGGCWRSDGSHLNRIGPELAGPRGICNVVGAVANCP